MNKTIFPQDQVFWYLKRPTLEPLRTSLETEIVIIGGGMAGLTAAQAFAQKGKKVVLLEAFYCGAGASGKSSGFITPNSELGLSDFMYRYGNEGGLRVWHAIEQGVEHIRQNIQRYKLDCDYSPEDSLIVANSQKALDRLRQEHTDLVKRGYISQYITKEQMPSVLGSNAYYGGVTYANSFGISSYKYVQEMRFVLMQQGVQIYEETPVLSFKNHRVHTLQATVQADHIIVCTDRFIPSLHALQQQIYHMQTFLLASQPLTPSEMRAVFPNRNLMVWDTDLIYNYYRMIGNRMLLGGGSFVNTYNNHPTCHSHYMYSKMIRSFHKRFPAVTMQFEQMWSGLIGVSKDIAPIAGADKDDPSIYYIAAAAGLPVAAMLGQYSADHIIDKTDYLQDYFSPYRPARIGGALQTILGNKLSFALSHLSYFNFP